jgi:hypothetical protein
MHHSPRYRKEARRLQAWELLQHDWSPRQIAEAMGVSDGILKRVFCSARAKSSNGFSPGITKTSQP